MSLYTEKDYVDVVDENDVPLGSFPKTWVGTDLLPVGAKKAGKGSSSSSPAQVVIPDGDPSKDWTNDQLDAYAAREDIDLKGATNKAARLDAIAAAKTEIVTS